MLRSRYRFSYNNFMSDIFHIHKSINKYTHHSLQITPTHLTIFHRRSRIKFLSRVLDVGAASTEFLAHRDVEESHLEKVSTIEIN